MNIIFLDVDGVLNSPTYLKYYCELTNKKGYSCENYPFDPDCLIRLKLLVENTNSNIVISSSWRKYEAERNKLYETLNLYDLDKYIVGLTPKLNNNRGDEITAYLNTLSVKPNFIILDDNPRGLDQYKNHLILINGNIGLTDDNIITGIELLTFKNINKQKKMNQT